MRHVSTTELNKYRSVNFDIYLNFSVTACQLQCVTGMRIPGKTVHKLDKNQNYKFYEFSIHKSQQ